MVELTQDVGPNLINRGGNEKKAIDSASSLRCLGFGRQEWSGEDIENGWRNGYQISFLFTHMVELPYQVELLYSN